ncbi:MAG: isoprenyl transferase [Paludibacteraceae bacterium]|nr:isoprenyl transferase [Paludibacteraceae bacterium]MBR2493034.1 isoprenyl transferase [Paludibacteraceae bacterium]MBR3871391.1 isoprenyl transferase [Paludibacteraceae bacterium]MBR6685957.1 isoprenyl transferase [Paludibacteraceae bacterium]
MNNFKEQINLENLPSHVAIIMDGNGRWAKKQGKLRLFGHNNGVSSVRAVTEASAELGLKYLTLYAFSTENWNRPQDEVNGLMKLLIQTIEAETPTLNKNNVRLLSIGDSSRMPEDVNKRLQACIKTTENNTGLTLILALSYSSRWEITKATQDIANDIAQGIIKKEEITEELISNYMCTKNIPDPELLIRTSGEYRISNFLLWQIAYSELYFTDVLWPDFQKEDLYKAIVNYQSRERRFGKTSEQINK